MRTRASTAIFEQGNIKVGNKCPHAKQIQEQTRENECLKKQRNEIVGNLLSVSQIITSRLYGEKEMNESLAEAAYQPVRTDKNVKLEFL